MVARSKLNVLFLGKIVIAIASVIFYCEFLHYYIVISQCQWPALNPETANHNVTDHGTRLHGMILADTHLLGSINGHWFDKLRREWQMHRAFQTTVALHRPKVFIFLGDLFDEGKWCTPGEFEDYVARFHDLFYVPEDSHVLIAVGNHDIGFHYSISPYLVSRFQWAFGVGAVKLLQIEGVTFVIINSMAMEGDDCFLCKPALGKIKSISKQLSCAAGNNDACEHWQSPELKQYSQPIILQHYPLFRDSDAVCNESDEAPEDVKYINFRERWECISKDSTELLLDELSPRLVFSGHTHHGCHIKHFNKGSTIHEYTISSFSWRNKNNPTFSMLTVSSNNYSIYKCHMPQEATVIVIYTVATFVLIACMVKKKLQSQSIIYTKVSRYID
ncbi:metallophosphoesterase 1 isoform X1 [Procambarus clarkii]|uniref:metallophosphoesterase 1 isoform X1 n=2 Tax=Procambarus clarkii TaxID=6728 RepID=UPI00374264B8